MLDKMWWSVKKSDLNGKWTLFREILRYLWTKASMEVMGQASD